MCCSEVGPFVSEDIEMGTSVGAARFCRHKFSSSPSARQSTKSNAASAITTI